MNRNRIVREQIEPLLFCNWLEVLTPFFGNIVPRMGRKSRFVRQEVNFLLLSMAGKRHLRACEKEEPCGGTHSKKDYERVYCRTVRC